MRRSLFLLTATVLAVPLSVGGAHAQERACRPLTGFSKYIKTSNVADRRVPPKPEHGDTARSAAAAGRCKKASSTREPMGRTTRKESAQPALVELGLLAALPARAVRPAASARAAPAA